MHFQTHFSQCILIIFWTKKCISKSREVCNLMVDYIPISIFIWASQIIISQEKYPLASLSACGSSVFSANKSKGCLAINYCYATLRKMRKASILNRTGHNGSEGVSSNKQICCQNAQLSESVEFYAIQHFIDGALTSCVSCVRDLKHGEW